MIILTDIEGTTSSIHFVKEVLFPYAKQHLENFVQQHGQEDAVKEQLAAAADIAGLDKQDLPAIVEQLKQWIAEDQKVTPLKKLQGMIWRDGYQQKVYQAHIYEDAWEALKRWYHQGIPLYVYSSGSVEAQQLFFQYSCKGDIRGLFSGFFDTVTGPKKSADSYREIARQIQVPVAEILFLSDDYQELQAASEAGCQVVWVVRPEDIQPEESQLKNTPFPVAHTFAEIPDIVAG